MKALVITQSITRRDERSLERYLSDISSYEVLTPEQEVELFKRYKSGDESALTEIVYHNLRFVVSVAKQYHFPGLWLGDLINEGNIGLIKAAQRFDVTKGFKFISYAVWWIRQSILQSISEKSRKIRLPSNMQAQTSKIMAKYREILQKEERKPSIEELADATGFNKEIIERSLASFKMCSSLDAPIKADEDTSFLEMMEDVELKAPDHDVAISESQQLEVKDMLDSLPPRQAEVLALFYGIGVKRSYSLNDIGAHIGVSTERARQIRDRALRKLRNRYKDALPTFSEN